MNDLVVHVKKSKYVIFSKFDVPSYDYKINGASIEQCTSIKDLGVILDSRLSFTDHIDSIVSKAFRKLYFV